MTARGGKREGAGRPSLPPEERKARVWVFLTPDQIAELKRIGNNNLSEGIRKLLAERGETK